jgi:hypothetical protein
MDSCNITSMTPRLFALLVMLGWPVAPWAAGPEPAAPEPALVGDCNSI